MAPSYRDLLASTKASIREISVEEVKQRLAKPTPPKVIDVREADEYSVGRLPEAISIPRGFLEMRIEEKAKRDEPLILYCAGGVRSAFAAKTLGELGYRDVVSMAGGYHRWHDAAYPIQTPFVLSGEQKERYRRHLSIPEVGEEGQTKLLKAKVLLMGAGGLGSGAALYLAAAGIGTLGIIDMDTVELSNLQRQVIHTQGRTGMPKTASAAEAIAALNKDVKVVPFQERLTAQNVDRIVEGFDLIIDGGDNFPTRYLLNDACVKHRKPNIHGSIYRFEGQVTTFVPFAGPCYRCLFPLPPPLELAPSCAEAGVFGVLPGIIGLFQATEALKWTLGLGTPLTGRLLTFDALSTTFRTLNVRRDPNCKVCGEGAKKIEYIDYQRFCSA